MTFFLKAYSVEVLLAGALHVQTGSVDQAGAECVSISGVSGGRDGTRCR